MTEIFDNSTFNMIGNSRFMIRNKSGSGNSTCPVPKAEQVRLINHLIDEDVVADFLQTLYDMGEDVISVELSNRRTSSRWGTAWPHKRKVIIYRHTAWVLIHEVAHIINDADARVDAKKANPINPQYWEYKRKSHGRQFGKYQETLYDLWMEHIEPRWENLKKAALVETPAPKFDRLRGKTTKAKFEEAFNAGKFGQKVSALCNAEGQTTDYVDNKKHQIIDEDGMKIWLAILKVDALTTIPHLPKRNVVTGGDVKAGDKVWFWNGKRKTKKIHGIVVRVNRKTARITGTEDGTDWRVSPSLLNKEI